VANEEQWSSYDRAVVDLAPPGGRPVRLVPDQRGVTGTWPDGLDTPVVVVTAWNPDSVLHPASDNRAAHRALVAELRRRGLHHWPAIGRDPDARHHEEGVGVSGLPEAEGIALGRAHGQAAVYVWTPDAWEVVSCTDSRRHVHGWRLVVDADGKGPDSDGGGPDGPGRDDGP
jgi:Protein of unknown function (DUF3293)